MRRQKKQLTETEPPSFNYGEYQESINYKRLVKYAYHIEKIKNDFNKLKDNKYDKNIENLIINNIKNLREVIIQNHKNK